MNAVEGFFGKLARRRLLRGVFDSVEQLERVIMEFIELHNGKEAKAFKWTASPDGLIAVNREGLKGLNLTISAERHNLSRLGIRLS